jgi:hypothetical protein
LGLILLILASGPAVASADVFRVWPETVSAQRHRPMLWLLSDRRLLRLRTRGGYVREHRIRARRSRIFGRYLASIQADFRRTCTGLKLLMAHSPHDRPDLASILVRAEISFSWRLARARLRLWGYRWGLY